MNPTDPPHPKADQVLILGALSTMIPVLSFFAWYQGAMIRDEVFRGRPYQWGGPAKTGYLIGKTVAIYTIISFVIGFVILAAVMSGTFQFDYTVHS